MNRSSAAGLRAVNNDISTVIRLIDAIPTQGGVTRRRKEKAKSCLEKAMEIGESLLRKSSYE